MATLVSNTSLPLLPTKPKLSQLEDLVRDRLGETVLASETRRTLPFAVRAALTGQLLADDAAGAIARIRFDPIEPETGDVFWLVRQLPEECRSLMPLVGHEVANADDRFVALLLDALNHIARVHPTLYLRVVHHAPVFAWVTLGPSSDTTLITSCSMPDLPLCVMLSRKAPRHIPPKTLTDNWHVEYLAENIVHESIHQALAVRLLNGELLGPGFSSTTSPRVEIPWRTDDPDPRNQAWELDRVLHAASVYRYLMEFRVAELQRVDLPDDARRGLVEAGSRAVEASNHLVSGMLHLRDHLSDHGIGFLERLVAESEAWAIELGDTLSTSNSKFA